MSHDVKPSAPAVATGHPHARAQGPGRPKDMEKRGAILAAAQKLFTRSGFEGTSMDAIAQAAGVSKLTVYSHFGDKDSLFREAAQTCCGELMPEQVFDFQSGSDVRVALGAIALAHSRVLANAELSALFRAVLGDCGADGDPRLGRLVWEVGPGRAQQKIEHFLTQAVAAGGLEIKDIPMAAGQFLALLRGDLPLRRLFICANVCEEADIRRNAEAAVEMFLRAYTPR
jgi:AcrR family transcriptional regulator